MLDIIMGLLANIIWIIVAIILFVVFILPGFALIRDNQVGILTKKMLGKPLPEGRIIATNGEVGVQASTLMPGFYWRFPIIWKIERTNIVEVPPGKIGVVESIDGKPIPPGRLLGDEVESNSFQDATAFINNGGCKGPQIATLPPGAYRINTRVFVVKGTSAVSIPSEKVGIVTANDGTPLPSGYIVAPEPSGDHKHFQNGQAFIHSQGYRGPQLETLQPGEYYINPLLFSVKIINVADIPPGYVAVIVSSVGKELTPSSGASPDISEHPDLQQSVHEPAETVLITNKNERGILRNPVAPGKYNLNTVAYRPELVPTSAVTIDWASRESARETFKEQGVIPSERVAEFFNYNQLRVTSKDGFQLDVDVRLIIRVPPEHASFVIARFGTVHNLIEQVAHPLIDSSFRNDAGDKAAMEFVHSRVKLQEASLESARSEFRKYHVEVQGLLISYIRVDEALLATQTRKEIAVQQKQQYEREAEAQEKRIQVAEKTARADKQPEVVAAKLSIEIAKDRADSARMEADGVRDATKAKADGEAYKEQNIGEGIARAYKAQTDVLGSDKVAILKVIDGLATNQIKIVPDILVTGESGADGGGVNSGNLVAALITMLLKKQVEETGNKK